MGRRSHAKQVRVIAPGPPVAHLAADEILGRHTLRERRPRGEQGHVYAAAEVDQVQVHRAVRSELDEEVVRFYVGVDDLRVVQRLDDPQHVDAQVHHDGLFQTLADFLFEGVSDV